MIVAELPRRIKNLESFVIYNYTLGETSAETDQMEKEQQSYD